MKVQISVLSEPFDTDLVGGEITPQAILAAAAKLGEAPASGTDKKLVALINDTGDYLDKILDEMDDPERSYALRKLAQDLKSVKL